MICIHMAAKVTEIPALAYYAKRIISYVKRNFRLENATGCWTNYLATIIADCFMAHLPGSSLRGQQKNALCGDFDAFRVDTDQYIKATFVA